MNGHHESCECQPCTIGREIGMDRALELIREMRVELAFTDDAAYEAGCDRTYEALITKADAFLKEHGHE